MRRSGCRWTEELVRYIHRNGFIREARLAGIHLYGILQKGGESRAMAHPSDLPPTHRSVLEDGKAVDGSTRREDLQYKEGHLTRNESPTVEQVSGTGYDEDKQTESPYLE